LEEDRLAPWRKSTAIKLQVEKDPEIKKLIRDAEDNYSSISSSGSELDPITSVSTAASQVAQDRYLAIPSPRPRRIRQLSPDDDEIPDPFPEPSKEIKKAKRHGPKVYKTRKSKAAAKSEVMVEASEPEEPTPNKLLSQEEEMTAARKRERCDGQTERMEETSEDVIPETPETESDVDSDATIPDVNGASFY
jgi:hypothetical protein